MAEPSSADLRGNFLAYWGLRTDRTVKSFVRVCIFYPQIFAYLRPKIGKFSGHSLAGASRGLGLDVMYDPKFREFFRTSGVLSWMMKQSSDFVINRGFRTPSAWEGLKMAEIAMKQPRTRHQVPKHGL
ncbi:hypothetical protein ARMGADRAFT_1064319 [Armillaria gallica]|uniref:Uncharacterized protein n=1 Tax=Armillaria gallica TaxID=47427 RepID=A0A2H3DPK9_ARMGA|nr:hypothetical protein ARMGADRAFT_1064319 [Armillaria gallica]